MRINRLITKICTMLFVITFIMPIPKTYAQDSTEIEIDESFDPFADYNEYEQQTEEEEDINFLRNGRYLTLAFIAGYRGFIGGGLAQAYRGNLSYGAEFNYFFNLQLAAGLSYTMGDHNVGFNSYTNEALTTVSRSYNGTVSIHAIDLHVKYYFNTDNVTKGLADLNPYGVLGTSFNIRSYSLDNVLTDSADEVWGFKFGGGIEIPILRNRSYVGFQGVYRYVQFPDENKRGIDQGGAQPFPIYPRLDGDFFDISVILGLNF